MFGQVESLPGAVANTAINTAVALTNAGKVSSLQKNFTSKLEQDAAILDYITNMVLRLKASGKNLVASGVAQPGTAAFEKQLQQKLLNYLVYRGDCNASIYVAPRPEDIPNQPRPILAVCLNTGSVQGSTNVPPEVGVVWATGCRNAQDEFRVDYINKWKDTRKFTMQTLLTGDLGSLGIFLKYGLSLFLVMLLITALRYQTK